MALEVPEWERLREEVQREVRPAKVLSGWVGRGQEEGKEEGRP